MLKFKANKPNRKEKDISSLFLEMADNTNKIVVITGPNGSGKSHFKQMIQSGSTYYKHWTRQPYSYCSEKDNLRTNKTKDHIVGVTSNSLYSISREQTTLLDLSEVTSFKDGNILLDEPEAGISLDNYNLLATLLNTASRYSKVYCFTNSPYICLMADTIYKVTRTKVTRVRYINKFKTDCKTQIFKTIKLFENDKEHLT